MKKSETVLFFCFVFILFAGCQSTSILYNGNSAADVRDNLSELQSEQSESAATSERITTTSIAIEKGLGDIEIELTVRASDNTNFEQIVEGIRNQKLTN